MRVVTYNKLVRDKIPEIIQDEGRVPKYHQLCVETYYKLLLEKLREEVEEFISSDNVEEIADILEVVHCILKVRGCSFQEIEKVREIKNHERGSFKDRIILESVIE